MFIQKMSISHSSWKSHLAMLRRYPSRPQPGGMEEPVLSLTRHGLPSLPQPLPLPSTLRLGALTRMSPVGPYRRVRLFLRTRPCPEEIRVLHTQPLGTRQRTLDLPQILERFNRAWAALALLTDLSRFKKFLNPRTCSVLDQAWLCRL